MPHPADPPTELPPSDWVGLKDAAKILGAHPATVRTWADQGSLPAQRTPGGHRRFRRSDLINWAATQRSATALATAPTQAQVVMQNALGRARIEIGGGQLDQLTWYRTLKPEALRQLGQLGRQVLDALRRYLTTPGIDASEAITIGTYYGELLRSQDLTLGQAIRGFFTFNDMLFDSIVQLGELNGGDRGESIRRTHTFTQAVLLALVEVYEH